MRKTLLSLFLIFFLLAPAHAATLIDVSDETLAKLEVEHAKAEGQIAQNDFQSAIRTYEDILLIEPDDETAYTNLGRIYMILGNLTKAEECFKNALYINPENEIAELGLQKIRDPDQGYIVSEEVLEEPEAAMPAETLTLAPQPEAPQLNTTEVRYTVPALSSLPAPLSPDALETETFVDPSFLSFEKQVQLALRNAGVYNGAVDGNIGPASRSAITRFQKVRGLKADGKVGPKTWAALEPYLRVKSPDSRS